MDRAVRGHGQSAAASGAQRLAREPDILRATNGDDRSIDCVVADGAGILPRLLTLLAESGIVVQNVRVREPSLDAVFLHITGTQLRD